MIIRHIRIACLSSFFLAKLLHRPNGKQRLANVSTTERQPSQITDVGYSIQCLPFACLIGLHVQSVNARKIDFPTSEAVKASIKGKKINFNLHDMRVKRLTKEQGKLFDINRFPNFHKTGSVKGMKRLYYGKDALLVRCGNYIYDVTSEPNIYEQAKLY